MTSADSPAAHTPPDDQTPLDPKRKPPQVFDHRKRFQYCHLLRQGLTKGAAARLLGVSPRTIELAAKSDPVLADRVRQARLECHSTAAAQVARAGEKSWRAAAWVLDRGRGAAVPAVHANRRSPYPTRWPAQMKQLVRNVLLEVIPELRSKMTAKTQTGRPSWPIWPPRPLTASPPTVAPASPRLPPRPKRFGTPASPPILMRSGESISPV